METALKPAFYLDLETSATRPRRARRHSPGIASSTGRRGHPADDGEGGSIFARHEAAPARRGLGPGARVRAVIGQRFASRTVTAAKLPEGHDWKTFNGAIKAHGVVLAGGQGKLTGKIFRLGHLGSVTIEEILGVIAVLETVTLEQGRRITPGAAVGAAYAAAADALGLSSQESTSGAGTGVRILVAAPIAP